MDLYTDPAGSANPAEQIHDYNVHIDSNDVFWMVRVPRESVIVRLDDGRARLRVCGLKVYDDHDIANPLTQGLGLPGDLGFPYPKVARVFPKHAIVSFDIEWDGIVAAAESRSPNQLALPRFVSQNGSHDQLVI